MCLVHSRTSRDAGVAGGVSEGTEEGEIKEVSEVWGRAITGPGKNWLGMVIAPEQTMGQLDRLTLLRSLSRYCGFTGFNGIIPFT